MDFFSLAKQVNTKAAIAGKNASIIHGRQDTGWKSASGYTTNETISARSARALADHLAACDPLTGLITILSALHCYHKPMRGPLLIVISASLTAAMI